MSRVRPTMLTGLVLAVTLAFGVSPDLRAAAKAGAQATAKAAATAAKKATGAGTQKANPGQTITQKRQLAADRLAAAKAAAAKGFKAPSTTTMSLATANAIMASAPMAAPHYFSVPNWANSPLPAIVPGAAVQVGNPLVARAYPTDTAANVFGVLPTPLIAGTLQSFQVFYDAGAAGMVFHAYVLRSTGVTNDYNVVFDSGPLTIPAASATPVLDFPTGGVTVLAGDLLAWYGQGIPLDIGTGTDQLYYPATAVLPVQNTTITLGGADYPAFAQARTYSFGAVVSDPTKTTITGGIRKFVDPLPLTCNPGLDGSGCPTSGKYIPIAVPDTTTYPGADYYEIGLVQTREVMHSDLPATLLREYVQLSTANVPGQHAQLGNANLDPTVPDTPIAFTGVTAPHYLGPLIVATKDRPVRIKFRNLLPTGQGGDLFLPVDTTFMGAGRGPLAHTDMEPAPQNPLCEASPKPIGCYADNRATLHLHGGVTPWISDGTPHQWITPAGESSSYPKGVSVKNVPDMGNDCDAAGSGCMTFYYTNQQSARLMFYHDHAWGITRLNVYAGEAAGYVITDAAEEKLLAGPLASVGLGIPLVIQDRTFVPDVQQLAATDPLWDITRWGGKGNMWLPHVYMPIQNPGGTSPNPFGRWFYGPWFWPPVSPMYGAIANPYYNANCDPNVTWCEPATMPGTPYLSSGMEAFHDTPVVNGTAYPTITLDPKAYRFRILNAANDRFFNLQWYVADGSGKEVALNAAEMAAALVDPAGVAPHVDKAASPEGPSWIQIGTEGGFLPAPVVIPNQEITYVTDPGRFDVGNVDLHSLLLGAAERADVVVDFSAFAGKTLILYNDAPAAFPARDPRYDYYAGNADQRNVGGAPSTLPGYGPNTRTIMQVTISNSAGAPFDLAALQAAFGHQPDGSGVFESGQHPIIVGQAGAVVDPVTIPVGAYNFAYGTNFASSGWCNDKGNPTTRCDGFVRIFEQGGDLFGFNTVSNALAMAADPTVAWTKTAIPLQPKGMHDEPNASAFDEYGRMTANLGLEAPGATPLLQNIILYPYVNPPTELIDGTNLPKGLFQVTPIANATDGTQIWKITHNGVDTHPIHFHLYDVQVLNRSPWDGQVILPPDANELGWKDTVRISPLEDTYVALRPVVPQVPFELPNSVRVLNPMMPEGMSMGFNNTDPNGNPTNPIVNKAINFGWEYVWHCHILSHEEMDMMRPQSLVMPPTAATVLSNPVLSTSGSGKKISYSLALSWTDNSANETAFVVQRNNGSGWTTLGTVASTSPDTLGTQYTYNDATASANAGYSYQVVAQNTVGYGAEFPTMTAQSVSNAVTFGTAPAAPTGLTATLQAGPQVRVAWVDNATNETFYRVERSTDGVTFTAIAPSLAANSTSYVDKTIVPGTTYTYRVSAVNGVGSTAASVSITVPAAPNAPSNLAAVNGPNGAGNSRTVILTWVDNATNETGFTIQRATNAAFTSGLATVNVGANVTTYTQTGLARNTNYYFRIRANNGTIITSAWVNAAPFPILTIQ